MLGILKDQKYWERNWSKMFKFSNLLSEVKWLKNMNILIKMITKAIKIKQSWYIIKWEDLNSLLKIFLCSDKTVLSKVGGHIRGGSDFCAGCGAIPKFVSKKRVFQYIRQPNGLGPTHKWEIWDFFWPTRILMKLGPRLPWGCYTMDLSSPNHLSKNSGNQVILKLFLGLGLILRSWPQWPRLHTVSQWVSAGDETH